MLQPLLTHPDFATRSGPVVLCIMDGVGLGRGEQDDGFATARTPNLDRMLRTLPSVALLAHGTAVGLPSDGDMGNSEVGHNAMGAGRVFDQGAKRVNAAIASEEVFETATWKRLVAGRTLHLMGLMSDGNVHSHIDHVHAFVHRAVADGVQRLRLHILTDGRDVDARSALTWAGPLEALLADTGLDYRVGSGGGRMHITMDRYEADWEMVARGWRTHVHGEGRHFRTACGAIAALYEEDPDVTDQYLPAFVISDADDVPTGRIEDGDSVLFFNFRGDRAIEISRAFCDDTFDHFDRGRRPDVFYAGIMEYDGDTHIPEHYLVEPPQIDRTVGEYLAAAGKRTFACSETQKFGHVTYFFNGNRSGLLDPELETYLRIPSDSRPFDERPWMKAAEITDAVIDAIESGRYDHLRLNLANGDMVGHTGQLEAVRIAMEAVDLQLGRLERAVRKAGGVLLVTADHGNAEEMWLRTKGDVRKDAKGRPMPRTAHTVHRVPFVVSDAAGALSIRELDAPGIASIGATILELCGLQPPDDYLPGLLVPA